MKIPVYRSRAISQQIRPGSPLRGTVRMNPQAMAQAEITKSEPMKALFDGAAQFATARWQASQEAQYNEAALAIEEGMREAEYTLGKSTDIYNVLDGENNWQNSMNELRDATIASVSNRSLQRKLSYAFEQNEIAARFRLRGQIDKKILAREQAAMAARMETKRRNLSQVGATIEDYNTELGIVINDQAKAVAGGRYSMEGVSAANYKLRTDIAADYLANAFNNDPDAAMQLFGMMTLQDEVAAGKITPEDAMARAGISDPYALHVLYNIERGDAVEIIQQNLATSLKFFDAEEKLETEQQEETNQRNTKAYNFVMSVQDTDYVEPETLRQLMGDAKFSSLPQITQEGGVTGIFAKQLLRDHLNAQFWASPEQQKKMNEELDTSTQFKFAPAGEGSETRYSELYALAERGMLTVEELNTDTFKITAAQHRELNMKIFNEADESLKVGSRLLKRAFKYNELDAQTDNPTLARASKSAFENADFALQDEFSRREAEGNPMTLAEIRTFAKEQIDIFGETFREELRFELEDYFTNQVQQAFPAIELNLTDPLGAIDRWYQGLPAQEQDRVRSRKTTFRRIIKSRFGNQGLGF
jgi:hypothetical protein